MIPGVHTFLSVT